MTWNDFAFWLVLVVGLAALAFHLAALWQITTAAKVSGLERIAWVVGVFMVPFVGAFAWFFYGRSRDRESTVRVDAIGDLLRG